MFDERDVGVDRSMIVTESNPIARLVPKNPLPKDETVVEFLRDLLGRIERGEEDVSEGICIHYLSSLGPKSSDGCHHRYWRYGLGLFSHIGLLQIASRDVMNKESEGL